MRIGELVETLIRVRDGNSLTQTEDAAKESVKLGAEQITLLNRQEIIAKVEHEIKFQRTQAGEYESGVHQDAVIFARYDQAAKVLEWVLGLLKGQVEYA